MDRLGWSVESYFWSTNVYFHTFILSFKKDNFSRGKRETKRLCSWLDKIWWYFKEGWCEIQAIIFENGRSQSPNYESYQFRFPFSRLQLYLPSRPNLAVWRGLGLLPWRPSGSPVIQCLQAAPEGSNITVKKWNKLTALHSIVYYQKFYQN